MMYFSASDSCVPGAYTGHTMFTWSYSKGWFPLFTSIMWSVLSIRNLKQNRLRG